MTELSIAAKLKTKLKGNDEQKLDQLTDALIQAAIDKNSTAMKLVVDLVEPARPKDEEQTKVMTDEELLERLAPIIERAAALRAEIETTRPAARQGDAAELLP